MKTKIFVLIVSCLIAVSVKSKAVETPTSDKAAGLERVPVLIGFTQVPGPSEQALVRSKGGLIKHSFHLVPAIAASIPEVAIEGLLHNPNVTNVESDIKVYAVDAELDNSWGVKRIGAGTAHDAGSKGLGVKVAIIDSGIDTTHPDLAANYVGGYDFVNDDDDPMDDAGHGTHVAGTVAAEDDGVGVVGVAPEADLYALKVLDSDGSGYYSDVIAALQWAVANGIQVTNNSYGSSGDPGPIVKAAFDLVEAAGILNVCAAGNRGRPSGSGDNVIYPARFESCVAVAATDKTDIRASFSSTGPDVEIAAPGVYVNSTILGGGYGIKSGTSMACPHAAGTAALFIADGIADVRAALQSTAEDLGEPGWDPLYGYGLVIAASDPGEPLNEPPTVSITSPANGSEFDSGESISFQGSASDNEDGNLTAELVWTSNINGQIGTGGSFSTSSLSDGDHTIIASVEDNNGASANDSINITVTPPPQNEPPTVTITSPADGSEFDAGTNISFQGTANDNEDGDLTPSLLWTSNLDGQIGTGGSVFTSTLSDGTHNITASVSDSDGADASDSITITVTAPITGTTMHVGDLDASKKVKGASSNWQVSVTAAIHDEDENSVANATVTARWTGAVIKTVSGLTGSNGTVTFNTGKIRGGTAVIFTVIDVTHQALTYDNTANHDPDGDSDNGSSIEIIK